MMQTKAWMGLCIGLFFLGPLAGSGQSIEKISYDARDSMNGYYLAVRPQSADIKGVLVLLCALRGAESMPPETRLHNVAYANGILTIYASAGPKLFADSSVVDRIRTILNHVANRYSADRSKFVLGGFSWAGNIVLRYTELAGEHPEQFPIQPKAVFGVDCFVDLFGLWHWSEREIKKNFFPGAVGDGKFILDMLTKSNGTIAERAESYRRLTPFYTDGPMPGNEQYLRKVPVRLYYDTDIEWQLKNRRNSYIDTDMPDGSEMISRLLQEGNSEAEFVPARLPGMRSNGQRSPNALSIVDETDCIQWIFRSLRIFNPVDPLAWTPPYKWGVPDGWRIELAVFPPPFSSHSDYTGMEDIRFPPGWGVAQSEEYWSVAYIFWLQTAPKMNVPALKKFVTQYYDGLIANAVRESSIPAGKVIPTTVELQPVKVEPDDLETYTGTVRILDYMAQQPILLNCMIHVKNCGGRAAVFIEISPKPFAHAIWRDMEKLKVKFECME